MLWHVALSWLGKIENRVKLAFNVLRVDSKKTASLTMHQMLYFLNVIIIC